MSAAEQRVRRVAAALLGVSPGEIVRCLRVSSQPLRIEVHVSVADAVHVLWLLPTAGDQPVLVKNSGLSVVVRSAPLPGGNNWQEGVRSRLGSRHFTPAHARKVLEVLAASCDGLPSSAGPAPAQELLGSPATHQALGAEWSLYEASVRGFEHFYATEVLYFEHTHAESRGVSLGVPEHARYGFLGRQPSAPEVLRHARSLGYATLGDGRFSVVPTLRSFRERAARLRFPSGLELQVFLRDAAAPVADDEWMLAMTQGKLLVQFARPAELAGLLALPRGAGLGSGPGHGQLHPLIYAPFHDLSTHAFAFHLVRADQFERLGQRVCERYAKNPALAVGLARFYENTLTRHCWEIWHRCSAPGQFADLLEQGMPGLLVQIDQLVELEDPHAPFVSFTGRDADVP